MAPRKQEQAEEKFGLKLSATQRKTLLNDVPLEAPWQEAIQATPTSQPVQLTLEEWKDLGDRVYDEACHTDDPKLERCLDGILKKVGDLLTRQLDLPEFDLSDPEALAELPPEALKVVIEELQQAMAARGQPVAVDVELTEAECHALRTHLPIEKSLADKLAVSSEHPQPVHLTLVDLLQLATAFEPETISVRGKTAQHFQRAAQKIAQGFEDMVAQTVSPEPKRKKSKAKPRPEPTKGTAYRLKITLEDTDRPIWRRVLTRDCTLAELHEIIQLSMGWEFSHLFEFEVGDERYTESYNGLYDDDQQPASARWLSELYREGVQSFRYVYDFGDSWEHTVKFEKPAPVEPRLKYPRCVEGEGACPPEDCGGVVGYEHMLEVLEDPDDPEYDDMREWLGRKFDPNRFNLAEANRRLSQLRE